MLLAGKSVAMKSSTILLLLGVAVITLVIGAALGSVVFSTTKTETTTLLASVTVTQTTSVNDSALHEAFLNHLLSIESGNNSLIGKSFLNNATVIVTGYAGGYAGTFQNATNIGILFHVFQHFQNLTLTSTSFEDSFQGNRALINSTLIMGGIGDRTFGLPTTISTEGNYTWTGSYWLISNETWNFLSR
jgi:hypothetical protein